jgi:hypothetical protein
MSRWRSSPRFRRRLVWAALLAAVAAGVVAVGFATTNVSEHVESPSGTTPPQVDALPASAALTKADALAVLRTSRAFVTAAVARRHLDRAYDMVGPELRSGLTRAQWVHGANPVVPFPAVAIADVSLAYSYRDDAALDLALVARPGSDTIGKTFRIELRRAGPKAPWRVVAWLPFGVSTADNVRSIARRDARAAATVEDDGPPLAAWWLAFPAGLLSCVLVLPVYLGVRSWRAARRAERDYRDAISSSSPS